MKLGEASRSKPSLVTSEGKVSLMSLQRNNPRK